MLRTSLAMLAAASGSEVTSASASLDTLRRTTTGIPKKLATFSTTASSIKYPLERSGTSRAGSCTSARTLPRGPTRTRGLWELAASRRAGKKKTPGVTGRFTRLKLERETGFEPATLSLGNGPQRNAAVSSGSQSVPIAENVEETGEVARQALPQSFTSTTGGTNRCVAPVLRSSGASVPARKALRTVDEGEGHLLSLAAVAAFLRISRATAYGLCDSGKLPHVRIGNTIRIERAVLSAFVAAARAKGDRPK
jgi:excisionase family DNA binding protein